MSDLITLIKKAAVEAVEGEKPTGVLFGTVTATSPLTVNVEQKLTLLSEMLIVPKSLTDFSVTAVVNDETFTLKINNSLKNGDKVLLLRMQGGQRFVIIDKLKEDV